MLCQRRLQLSDIAFDRPRANSDRVVRFEQSVTEGATQKKQGLSEGVACPLRVTSGPEQRRQILPGRTATLNHEVHQDCERLAKRDRNPATAGWLYPDTPQRAEEQRH